MNIIQYYKSSFIRAKKNAGSNWILAISIFNALGVCWLISSHLSFQTWLVLDSSSLHPVFYEILMWLPLIYMAFFVTAILDKVTRGFVYITMAWQKAVFNLLQKFDVWYWKKTGRESVLCSAIWKCQLKITNLDQHQRNKLLLIGGVLVFIWYLFRFEVISL